MEVIRLKPYQYLHLLDNNTGVTRVLVGPLSYTKLDHEKPQQTEGQAMICVPMESYCIIGNPVLRDAEGKVLLDATGQVAVRIGDLEMRFAQQPFPLYPREALFQQVTKQRILSPLQALRLRATRNFQDGVKKRSAGDEWVLPGPCTYVPRIDVDVVNELSATVIMKNQAIKIRALQQFTDRGGSKRIAGEEWLHDQAGAFLPDVEEQIVETLNATVLSVRRAIHVAALQTFVDRFKVERKAGSQWLVTFAQSEFFIPSPNERIDREVALTLVGARQYAVVLDFIGKDGSANLGKKELRKGLTSFFLHPGESLEGGKINDVQVLSREEALVLSALENFEDGGGVQRVAGTRWMLCGPSEYIPPVQVRILERRRAIPLDRNEGVYIRDIRTGVVRAHIGKTVMLNEHEELWGKELPPLVEELLQQPRLTRIVSQKNTESRGPRVKHMVVTCNGPHNALVQVYDYSAKEARVSTGPSLVMLMPDEEFTVLSLSGSKPKEADQIKSLCLHLGPDFMTDIITVETSDHARLSLHVSYNWEFDTTSSNFQIRTFSVPDFVGDACKAIASRIRGSIAGSSFDEFHKNSTGIIRLAVFGIDKQSGNLRDKMSFRSNGLIITNVDIHSVDPVDPKTREALTKSVQLAIEITTKSQEAVALHQAASLEQQAKGKLERQIIHDKAEAEKFRKKLLLIEAENAAVESMGASRAQAKAVAEAKLIEGQTDVQLAQKKSDAQVILATLENELEEAKRNNELSYREHMDDLELWKIKGLALIETEKFAKVIAAVGRNTIKAIARAGPDLQVKLLQGLGLQGYLVTDGSNPINLFNTANGMTAKP